MTVPATNTRPPWAAGLSDRHWLFCEAYAAEPSGVEAALAAGLGHDRKSAREIMSARARLQHQASRRLSKFLRGRDALRATPKLRAIRE